MPEVVTTETTTTPDVEIQTNDVQPVPEPAVQPAPATTVVDNGANSALGASSLIGTVVWSIVVLVVLAVALYALHVYLGWF